jgi:hypothetical protein
VFYSSQHKSHVLIQSRLQPAHTPQVAHHNAAAFLFPTQESISHLVAFFWVSRGSAVASDGVRFVEVGHGGEGVASGGGDLAGVLADMEVARVGLGDVGGGVGLVAEESGGGGEGVGRVE